MSRRFAPRLAITASQAAEPIRQIFAPLGACRWFNRVAAWTDREPLVRSLELPLFFCLFRAVALRALETMFGVRIGRSLGGGSVRTFLRSITLALEPLAHRLAVAADRLGPLANSPFRRLLVGAASFHLAKRALALHFLLQDAERAVDIVVTDIDLHGCCPFAS
jgi:hypothetical protein